jgi:hypothetical protein
MTRGRAVTFIRSRRIGWTEEKQQSLHALRSGRMTGGRCSPEQSLPKPWTVPHALNCQVPQAV